MIDGRQGILRQFVAGYSACILAVCYGSAIGWLSPVQIFLESDRSPVGKLSNYQIAWLASIPYLGAVIGTFVFAPISERIGRKTMLFSLAIPYLLSGITITFTTSFALMLVARIAIGVCVPSILSSISLYIAEISDPSIRGNLGSGVLVFCNVGVVIMFIGGTFLSYFTYNIIIVILPSLFIVIFWMLPESPVYLLKIDNVPKCKKALSWLKATNSEIVINVEVEKLRAMFFDQSNATRKLLTWREVFATKYYWKSFILGLILMAGPNFSGILVLNSYFYTILGTCLDMEHPGSYPAYFLLLGNVTGILALFLTNYFSRKFILIGTRLGCATATFGIGMLLLLKDYGIILPSFLYLIFFAMYNLFFGVGLSSIVFVIFGELFSVECRDKFMQVMLLFHFTLCMTSVTLYPITVVYINLYSWFFIFTFSSVTASIVLMIYLPETSNKTIAEIAHELTRGSREVTSTDKEKNLPTVPGNE